MISVFSADPGAGVREGQRCAYRNGACGVRKSDSLTPLKLFAIIVIVVLLSSFLQT